MTLRIAGAMVLLAASMAVAEPAAPIAGDYVEARSNHVYTCGCLYSGEMVTDGREAMLVWSFERGSYQGASLAGVKVLAVLSAEGSLSVERRGGRAVLYLDGVSSDAQKQAVVSLLGERYPLIGEIMAVHAAPIFFQKGPAWVNIEVPGVAAVKVRTARLPEDAHLGSVLWYGPFIPLAEPTLAMTLLYEYQGNELAKRWWHSEPGITGYFGRFTLSL